MGGAFGEVHGAKLTGLLRAARDIKSIPVLILFDTGGVRLQEANAGELAIAEIMRAMMEARTAGVKVIGLIGGRVRMLWRRWLDRRLLLGARGVRTGAHRGVRPRGDRDQSRRRGVRFPGSRPGLAHHGRQAPPAARRRRRLRRRQRAGLSRRRAGAARPASELSALDKLKAEQARLADRLRQLRRLRRCRRHLDGRRHRATPSRFPSLPADQFIALANKIGRTSRDAR